MRPVGRPRDQPARDALGPRRDQRHDPHRHANLRRVGRRLPCPGLARRVESPHGGADRRDRAASGDRRAADSARGHGRRAATRSTPHCISSASAGLPWEEFSGGFETLVAGSAPVYWGLCLLTGIAVFVLRAIDPTIERPFPMPLFPLPALVFCGNVCVHAAGQRDVRTVADAAGRRAARRWRSGVVCRAIEAATNDCLVGRSRARRRSPVSTKKSAMTHVIADLTF